MYSLNSFHRGRTFKTATVLWEEAEHTAGGQVCSTDVCAWFQRKNDRWWGYCRKNSEGLQEPDWQVRSTALGESYLRKVEWCQKHFSAHYVNTGATLWILLNLMASWGCNFREEPRYSTYYPVVLGRIIWPDPLSLLIKSICSQSGTSFFLFTFTF